MRIASLTRSLVLAAAVLAACRLVRADPPRVVSVTPDTGDIAEATVREITVVFNQDMNPGGRSVCGGGPTFPAISGQPSWRDARTFVIPVTLEAGKEYRFSINCPSANNFKGVNGQPAEAYPVTFRTAAAGEPIPSLTEEQARELAAALRRAIDDRYSHRDTCGVDWERAFTDKWDSLQGARTPAAFARAAAALLRPANDLHATVRVSGATLATARRATPPNADYDLLARTVDGFRREDRAPWGRLEGGVGYILIPGWGDEAVLTAALGALDALKDAPGLVVDVRFNSGGDEVLARRFAGRFVEEPTVYSKSRIRSPDAPDGWLGPFDRMVKPDGARYAGRVAVLVGPVCMSSCESFVLMMREPGTRELFGAQTFGSSGNPKPHELGHGVTVALPSWVDLTAEGEPVEGRGIAPDHPVEFQRGSAKDAVLEGAAAWVRGGS